MHRRIVKQQSSYDDNLGWVTESIDQPAENGTKEQTSPPVVSTMTSVEISVHRETPGTPPPPSTTTGFLSTSVSTTIITTSCSADTLNGETNTLNLLSGPSSPSNLSSVTLVGSTGSGSASNVNENKEITISQESQRLFKYSQVPSSPLPERKRKPNSETSDKENDEIKTRSITSPKEIKTPSPKEPKKVEIEIEAKAPESVSSKPTIVSAIKKSSLKEREPRTPNRVSCNVLQPNMNYLTMNRRPSTGTIGVPMAALTQHRHSLQMNSSEGGFGIAKVSL